MIFCQGCGEHCESDDALQAHMKRHWNRELPMLPVRVAFEKAYGHPPSPAEAAAWLGDALKEA